MAFWRFIKKIFRGLKGKKKPLKKKSGKPRPRKPRLRTVKKKSLKPPKKKKRVQPKKKIKAKTPAKPAQKEVGTVTHYFDRISVAVLKVSGPLKIGDSIRFASSQGEFVQMVVSMQIDRKDILKAPKGSEIGLKTLRPVGKGDKAFMIVEG